MDSTVALNLLDSLMAEEPVREETPSELGLRRNLAMQPEHMTEAWGEPERVNAETQKLIDELADTSNGLRTVQRLQYKQRAILQLIAQGFSPAAARRILRLRGIHVGLNNLYKVVRSPLFQAELDRAHNITLDKVAENAIVTRSMADDAMKLLHSTVKTGTVTETIYDENGNETGGLLRRSVSPKDRIRAAKEIADRFVETAPITRELANAGRGVATEDSLAEVRARFAEARRASAIPVQVVNEATDLAAPQKEA